MRGVGYNEEMRWGDEDRGEEVRGGGWRRWRWRRRVEGWRSSLAEPWSGAKRLATLFTEADLSDPLG